MQLIWSRIYETPWSDGQIQMLLPQFVKHHCFTCILFMLRRLRRCCPFCCNIVRPGFSAKYFLVVDLVSSGGAAKCDLLGLGKGWGEASLSHHKNQSVSRICLLRQNQLVWENNSHFWICFYDLWPHRHKYYNSLWSSFRAKKVKLWCSCCISYVFQIKIP